MPEFEKITVSIHNNMAGTSHVLPKALQAAIVEMEAGGLVESMHFDIKFGNVRALTEEDMVKLREIDSIHAPDQAEQAMVTGIAKALDLVLTPEEAEDAIGNLLEAYGRRRSDRAHAKCWIWAQTFWILLSRGIDLLGRVRKAWAGKA